MFDARLSAVRGPIHWSECHSANVVVASGTGMRRSPRSAPPDAPGVPAREMLLWHAERPSGPTAFCGTPARAVSRRARVRFLSTGRGPRRPETFVTSRADRIDQILRQRAVWSEHLASLDGSMVRLEGAVDVLDGAREALQRKADPTAAAELNQVVAGVAEPQRKVA